MTDLGAPIQLTAADARRYQAIRRQMLEQFPTSFGASPDDDAASDPDRLQRTLTDPSMAIFAHPVDRTDPNGRLAGVVGIHCETRAKFRHRAKVWGVYVDPDHAGRGLGRSLLEAAISWARHRGVDFVDLGVSENSPGAQRLYEALGFRQWGREPESLEYEGRRYDEIYMTLRLG